MPKRNVIMPEKVYLAEHKKLIKLLQSGNKSMKKEAKAQQQEVLHYLKKRLL